MYKKYILYLLTFNGFDSECSTFITVLRLCRVNEPCNNVLCFNVLSSLLVFLCPLFLFSSVLPKWVCVCAPILLTFLLWGPGCLSCEFWGTSFCFLGKQIVLVLCGVWQVMAVVHFKTICWVQASVLSTWLSMWRVISFVCWLDPWLAGRLLLFFLIKNTIPGRKLTHKIKSDTKMGIKSKSKSKGVFETGTLST